jgi:hypothetical protein
VIDYLLTALGLLALLVAQAVYLGGVGIAFDVLLLLFGCLL